MKKRFVPIYSILAIAIILLAALAPSCGGGTTTGTIVVRATLCGNPWQGAVNYTLTPAGGAATNGTVVPTTHSSMLATTWACAYLAGGPPGTFLNSIQPSASQSLVAGGTITFTFDFEKDQDAAIEWETWTLNGEPIPVQQFEVIAVPCNIIDAHFEQWVKGCDGYNVTMNETSWLNITQIAGPPGPPVMIFVIDDWCALNKTPTPREKVSQHCTINGEPADKGMSIPIMLQGPPVSLDVHTQWKLVKETNYTKAINWFGISVVEPLPHQCVLFELVVPGPGQYVFSLTGSAAVALVGSTDVDTRNNYDESPVPPLTLTVNVGP